MQNALIEVATKAQPGAYIAAPRKKEFLALNLLKVQHYPEYIYVAETEHTSPKSLAKALREHDEYPPFEWVAKSKRIFSFHNLEEYPWKEICDVGTIEPIDTNHFALSDDEDLQRDFVQLLNQALRAKVSRTLLYSRKYNCHYFKPFKEKIERDYWYESFCNRTKRDVVKGYGMRHIDIKFGLINYGPFDIEEGQKKIIKLGIVGTSETIEGLSRWIESCRSEIGAKESKQPTLFPFFPGAGSDGPFRSDFVISDDLTRTISNQNIQKLEKMVTQNDAANFVANIVYTEIQALSEKNDPPDVVLCALPLVAIEKAVNKILTNAESEEESENVDSSEKDKRDINLRGLLKAKCMSLKMPIQIVWPTTYDQSASIKRKLKSFSEKTVQDEATRAWNFFSALYYKARGLPWRLVRNNTQLRTSYVGLSFYETFDQKYLYTSTAQMFDERGEGLILRGNRAVETKDDRQPHLTEESAYDLLKRSLEAYKAEHGHSPARLVLHKSSKFRDSELNGFRKALEEKDIGYADFLVFQKGAVRVMRHGGYPPLRGTLADLSKTDMVLYTRGSVDFFKTYPGMYIPSPLHIRCQDISQTKSFLAEEILALTKMNWNNTQFDGGGPITIKASRYVGEILRYVSDDAVIFPRYSFYM